MIGSGLKKFAQEHGMKAAEVAELVKSRIQACIDENT